MHGGRSSDRTVTVVVVAAIIVAALGGRALRLAIPGMQRSDRNEAEGSHLRAEAAVEPQEAPVGSLAYRRGYEHGTWRGEFDRDRASYAGLLPDDLERRRWAGTFQYRSGTREFGDFWAGYEAGYLASRQ